MTRSWAGLPHPAWLPDPTDAFWAPIVCLFLLVLPVVAVFILAGAGRTTTTVALTALDLVAILAGVVGVGFLSFAYQHFFEGGDRRAD